MSLANQIFGKSPENLIFKDIENYFHECRNENDKIEFKSYHARNNNHTTLENTIIETVSALLNSSGGLIIWGAPEGKKVEGQKEKIFQGELSPVTTKVEKDKFINRISTLITPTPNGIRFHEIIGKNCFIYIIEVDQSLYSPHQYDNKYHMRLDGQTRPAPHHYIEALFRKVKFPNLVGEIKFLNGSKTTNMDLYLCHFEFKVKNLSPFQNEEDLHISFNSNRGKYQNYDYFNSLNVSHSGGTLTHSNVKPVFFFGAPFVAKISLLFHLDDLEKPLLITITFGGRASPLRRTEYYFKLEVSGHNVVEQGSKKITENEHLTSILGNLPYR